ncbi:hypothetical protein C7974DRAFT_140113 [Boeremia exigua]|uniref:uncharacterized protein n=1 Tax=Boeremia exigua TaxID=749465 RepID=UPI001E8D20B8|nr:uncharacterized protein C7974DRAFT_140113 [Boeremia exigua]KAH6639884.1 hypothetical protein C7974DRAFT_140113 [Boeremia exigua]
MEHTEAKASKWRRQMQNRQNQRARRLRNKGPVAGNVSALPYRVERWRLDELDELTSLSSTSNVIAIHVPPRQHGCSPTTPPRQYGCSPITPPPTIKRPSPVQGPERPDSIVLAKPRPVTPPSLNFPLSTDHLLHLIQYNVFRAFVTNKTTLNLLLKGWPPAPASQTTCPIAGPHTDATMIYPLNPNIPAALAPTRTQQETPHPLWINFFPFPRMRDNLIRAGEALDHGALLYDLIGALMGGVRFSGLPASIALSGPETAEGDESSGLVVWGEPHEMRNWEATPGFVARWGWAVEGCGELLEASNRWRAIRGEEPLQIPIRHASGLSV